MAFRIQTVTIGVALGVLLGVVTQSRVMAQGGHQPGWLDDRQRAEGRGFRVGNLEIHPGVGVEIGYDSNIFFSDANPQGSAVLRATPHLYISTLTDERSGEGSHQGSPPMIQLRSGISASYFQYFASDAKSNLGLDFDLRLTIAPERPVSVTLTETFGRTIRPFTENLSGSTFARDRNNSGVEFNFATRGNIFKANLGYRLLVDFFEADLYRYATNLSHQIEGGWAWRFLPQTALLYDIVANVSSYPKFNFNDPVLLADSVRLRTRVGVNGAFTNRFSVLAMIGYGVGFYDSGDDYESVLGQLQATWAISPSTKLAVGYDRDFFRSTVGGFHRRDRGYANFQLLAFGSLLLGLEGSVAYVDFGAPLSPVAGGTTTPLGTTADRTDIRVSGSLFGEYRITDWLAFNGTVSFTADYTDFNYLLSTGVTDPADYSKFEAWFGVRAFY